eukprot:222063_1
MNMAKKVSETMVGNITLPVTVNVLRIETKANMKYQAELYNYNRSHTIEWKIDQQLLYKLITDKHCNKICSNIYDGMWCIHCFIDQDAIKLALQIITLPTNISELKVQCTFYCKTNGKTINVIHVFHYSQATICDPHAIISISDFEKQSLNNNKQGIICFVDILILKEYDLFSNDITIQRIENKWKQFAKQNSKVDFDEKITNATEQKANTDITILDNHTLLIVSGFIRSVCLEYHQEIYHICLLYVYDFFMYTYGKYIWNINDLETLHQKWSKIESNVFGIAGLLWKIYFVPSIMSGFDTKKISVELLSFPISWKMLKCGIIIECVQTGTRKTATVQYRKDYLTYACGTCFVTKNQITKSKMKQLSFKLIINILQIRYDSLLYKTKWFDDYETNLRIKWKIDKQLMDKMKQSTYKQRFESNIFNSMWLLSCYPKGGTEEFPNNDVILSLHLHSLPNGLHSLGVQFNLYCIEANIMYSNIDCNFEPGIEHSWISNTFSSKNFNKFDTITFYAEIIVLNQTTIGNQYEPPTVIQQRKQQFKKQKEIQDQLKIQQMQMTAMQNQINDLNSKILNMSFILENTLQKQNLSIHSNVEKINEQQNSTEIQTTQKNHLYDWLNDIVNLPQYYSVFINSGFDDLNSLIDLTMDEMSQIGIFKLGHKKKLMKFIKKIEIIQS